MTFLIHLCTAYGFYRFIMMDTTIETEGTERPDELFHVKRR